VTATPSRRGFIGAALGTAGVLAAGGGGYGVARATAAPPPSEHAGPVSFYGAHQAGIDTPAQDRLAFAAFDVTSVDIAALRALLGSWAAAAAQMASGQPVGPVETVPQAPPVDTGEALGLEPAQLTITVGFGLSLFDDRFGLANRRPAALADLPAFPGDGLDPRRTGGDLGVQACSNDPQVAFHVIRNFARIARGTAVMRWSQLGFGRTSTTSTSQATPRNLMGFKDGTNNIKAEHGAELNAFVWVGEETDQSWMRGGTYLVARRIRMLIESWDADYLADQERVIGRIKESGAPLGRRDEFDAVDLPERRSPPMRTSGWRRRPATAERRCCAAVSRSPTESTRSRGSSTPDCSSSPSRRIRASSSSRSRRDSLRTTPSTSTSSTPAAPCSRCRPD
jgi:deferrochelatase/peroxidase EfeB